MIIKIILANIATFAVCYLLISFTEMDWLYLFGEGCNNSMARVLLCFTMICATTATVFIEGGRLEND